MTQDIRITTEDGLIRVAYRGVAEYRVITEMLRKVGRIASKTRSQRLLFDIREADYQHYYKDTIRHAQEGPSLGIHPKRFRIAFLGSAGNSMLQYIESVSVDRGFRVKVFTEESEAETWLRSLL